MIYNCYCSGHLTKLFRRKTDMKPPSNGLSSEAGRAEKGGEVENRQSGASTDHKGEASAERSVVGQTGAMQISTHGTADKESLAGKDEKGRRDTQSGLAGEVRLEARGADGGRLQVAGELGSEVEESRNGQGAKVMKVEGDDDDEWEDGVGMDEESEDGVDEDDEDEELGEGLHADDKNKVGSTDLKDLNAASTGEGAGGEGQKEGHDERQQDSGLRRKLGKNKKKSRGKPLFTKRRKVQSSVGYIPGMAEEAGNEAALVDAGAAGVKLEDGLSEMELAESNQWMLCEDLTLKSTYAAKVRKYDGGIFNVHFGSRTCARIRAYNASTLHLLCLK